MLTVTLTPALLPEFFYLPLFEAYMHNEYPIYDGFGRLLIEKIPDRGEKSKIRLHTYCSNLHTYRPNLHGYRFVVGGMTVCA